MKKTLTEKDIKELRHQCRMGYIIPSMLFLIGTVITISVFEFNFDTQPGLNGQALLIVLLVFAMISFLISYSMNWKYLADIRAKKKVIETKVIQRKESKIDYEAGSGTLHIGQEMNAFDSFSIIVDNCRYRVEKDLFMNCNEGDEVNFNYGPTSKHLINIELK